MSEGYINLTPFERQLLWDIEKIHQYCIDHKTEFEAWKAKKYGIKG